MKLLIVLGVSGIMFACAVANISSDGIQGGISPQLSCKGLSSGRSICIDSTARTWNASKTYCGSMGMELGSFNTSAEFEEFGNVVDAELINGQNYWTSGRDSYELEQFRWDGNNGLLDGAITFQDLYSWDYSTCLFFRKGARNNSMLSFSPCSETYYTLCQPSI